MTLEPSCTHQIIKIHQFRPKVASLSTVSVINSMKAFEKNNKIITLCCVSTIQVKVIDLYVAASKTIN